MNYSVDLSKFLSVGLTDDPPDKANVQHKLRYQRLYLYTQYTQVSTNIKSISVGKTAYLRVMALWIRAANEDRHDRCHLVCEVIHSSICEVLTTYKSQDDVQSRHRDAVRQSEKSQITQNK